MWDLLDRRGKRWRPVFGLLLLEALGTPSLPYEDLQCVTAELLHTGSLIIDDIEDASLLRRGEECIHLRYGESVAINAANTLYFLPFLCLFNHPRLDAEERRLICEIIVRHIIRGHFGQSQDIQWSSRLDRTNLQAWLADGLREKILEMYLMKTGAPVQAVAEAACVIAGAGEAARAACVAFARGFSVAFQIMDDVRNFAESAELGKTPGEDLREGKLTYAIVRALDDLPEAGRSRLADILCSRELRASLEGFQEGCDLVRRSGSLEACRKEAQKMACDAWRHLTSELPNSWPRMILASMAFGLLDMPAGAAFPYPDTPFRDGVPCNGTTPP